MFSKAYKLKSNNTLKNSEKKHLVQRIQNDFPSVTDEKAKELVPIKSNCSCMKLVLHSEETVGVYVVDSVPVVIETADRLVPTVCALWKLPDLLPTITIHALVLTKIQGGAPLYVPGVITTEGNSGPMATFPAGAVIAARTHDNAAAAVVGRALISSGDIMLRDSGVCLETWHVYGDLLCKEPKFGRIERPKLDPAPAHDATLDNLAAHINQLTIQKPVKEEWPSLVKQQAEQPPVPNEPQLIRDPPEPEDTAQNDAQLQETVDLEMRESEECGARGAGGAGGAGIPVDMDGLLRWALLTFLKLHAKHVQLPLKTNLLYKNHLFPLCPPERTLDVKKSSYKKMGRFLEAMQQEGLIEVREIEKGVDAVTAINAAHEALRSHRVPDDVRERAQAQAQAGADAGAEADYTPPLVREMYCVTASVVELFAPLKKGTTVTPAEVRSTLTEYVKAKQLHAAEQKGSVALDTLLAAIAGKQPQELMKWDALMSSVQGKMTACTEMRFADGHVKLIKSKLEPVKMQVATRSGNKKVTLVSNLESFGFNLVALSRVCQAGVAASCGVTRTPGAKADQLMLQGDQTYFIAKLLIEKYGLPKKYVEGADKALKKKK